MIPDNFVGLYKGSEKNSVFIFRLKVCTENGDILLFETLKTSMKLNFIGDKTPKLKYR
jgi:hypothetical protein